MIRLAIIGNHNGMKDALWGTLAKSKSIEIVYEASHIKHLSGEIKSVCPDVILLDLVDLAPDDTRKILALRSVLPEVQFLMLFISAEISNILEAIKAGASGCLLASDPPRQIIDGIHAVVRGEYPLNGKMARSLINHCVNGVPKMDTEAYALTKREREILFLLLEGFSYKLICDKCNISLNTLFTHARKIYKKVQVHSRSELSAKFKY